MIATTHSYKTSPRNARSAIVGIIVVIFCSQLSAQIMWNSLTASAPFCARSEHSSVLFDKKIWILGGYNDAYSTATDVWQSTNGKTWEKSIDSVPYPMRVGIGLLSYKNSLWITAGWNGC
ncbi:MAG: hypothetical protein JW795_15040 [Chitinivibrionales bacterium]|nr:hypothetical protein [Chitinivibrionales bacterium]